MSGFQVLEDAGTVGGLLNDAGLSAGGCCDTANSSTRSKSGSSDPETTANNGAMGITIANLSHREDPTNLEWLEAHDVDHEGHRAARGRDSSKIRCADVGRGLHGAPGQRKAAPQGRPRLTTYRGKIHASVPVRVALGKRARVRGKCRKARRAGIARR